MDPIPLKLSPSNGLVGIPSSPEDPKYPHVWLDNLQEVDIPEEGEIRFRYSRKKKVETETKDNESMSVELCLKAITDICDCEGKEDDGMNEPDGMPKDEDAEKALDRIMGEMKPEDMTEEED